MRDLRPLVTVAVLAVAALTFPAVSSAAPSNNTAATGDVGPLDGRYKFVNQRTGLCVEDTGSFVMRGAPCNNGVGQTFWVSTWGDGHNTMSSAASGRCVDDSWDFNLRNWWCNGQDWQRWSFELRPGGWIRIRNKATGRCLDSSEVSSLRTWPCNELEYQRWAWIAV